MFSCLVKSYVNMLSAEIFIQKISIRGNFRTFYTSAFDILSRYLWETFWILFGYFLDTFWILLGYFWDTFEYFWDPFGILLGYFLDSVGIFLGYFRDTFGILLGQSLTEIKRVSQSLQESARIGLISSILPRAYNCCYCCYNFAIDFNWLRIR